MKRASTNSKGKVLDADTLDSKAPKESADKDCDIKTDTGLVFNVNVIFLTYLHHAVFSNKSVIYKTIYLIEIMLCHQTILQNGRNL